MDAPPQTSVLGELRLTRGLSLRTVAGEAGIDPGHLSRVECGQACLSVDGLGRLARVLGPVDMARLLTRRVEERARGRELA